MTDALPTTPSPPRSPRVCHFMHAWGPWARYQLERMAIMERRKLRACTYCGETEDVPDPSGAPA